MDRIKTKKNWEIFETRLVEAPHSNYHVVKVNQEEMRSQWSKAAQIRTFERTVKAGGAYIPVVVIVARKERV